MREIPKKDIFIVRADTEAMSLMMKICKNPRPGAVICVTDKEFAALKDDVIRIGVNW